MPYCTRCGKEIQEGERCSCQGGAARGDAAFPIDPSPLHQFFGIERRHGDTRDAYEHGMRIVPDNLAPDANEIPVRQYDLCTLRSRIKLMKAEGRLQITNRRILFRAKGTSLMGPTVLQHEFSLAELSGFQIQRNFRFSMLDLLFLVLLSGLCFAAGMGAVLYFATTRARGVLLTLCGLAGLVGIALTYFLGKHYILKSCLAALAAALTLVPATTVLFYGKSHDNGFVTFLSYLLYLFVLIALVQKIASDLLFSFKPNLRFNVVTKFGSSIVNIRCERGGFAGLAPAIHALFTGYNEVLPTAQTDEAIREVGAIVADLQKSGDAGVAKWRRD